MNVLQKYTDAQSRFLVINGSLVHYKEEGNGPTLVLFHGAFSSLHTYDDWVSRLKLHYRVIRLDLPGFGLTGSIHSRNYTLANLVEFIKLFFDTLKISDCYLAGSSLGGWLSWEFTIKYPECIKKLILIDSAGFLDARNIPLPFRMARTPFVNRVVKFVVSRNVLTSFLEQVYYNRSKITEELVDRYYDLFSREGNPEAFFALVNQKFVDNTKMLKTIKVPVMIIWGQEDSWLPVENAYKFHDRIPNNEMVIYERTGHIPMEEIPWDTVEDLISFLKS